MVSDSDFFRFRTAQNGEYAVSVVSLLSSLLEHTRDPLYEAGAIPVPTAGIREPEYDQSSDQLAIFDLLKAHSIHAQEVSPELEITTASAPPPEEDEVKCSAASSTSTSSGTNLPVLPSHPSK